MRQSFLIQNQREGTGGVDLALAAYSKDAHTHIIVMGLHTLIQYVQAYYDNMCQSKFSKLHNYINIVAIFGE